MTTPGVHKYNQNKERIAKYFVEIVDPISSQQMTDFEWPWEYNFPPFFTVQPHAKTRETQLNGWRNLVLKYCRHHKKCTVNLGEDEQLFSNSSINRKLPNDGILLVLEDLERTGNATPLDKKRLQWEIYWHTLEEWASLIYEWAVNSGSTNSVCTIFELISGDNVTDQEFYGLNQNVFIKALKRLEAQGKCEVIGDNDGVKFF